MSTPGYSVVERHCDAVVVGGSAAGLAAALQLGRQRRSVIVVDAGDARNAPAAHMHSYLGFEAAAPSVLTAAGREEVRSYGGEVLDGRVISVTPTANGQFRAELAGGHSIVARKVLAATGLVDELPDIPGLIPHWGREVVHCPFCHGFEFRDQRVVHVVTHPTALHTAELFRQLTERFCVVLHDPAGIDEAEVATLRAAGVDIYRTPVARVVEDGDGRLVAVELADGQRIEADCVAVGPRFKARAEPFAGVGLQPVPHPSGLGDVLGTDSTLATSVPGVYAAGNVTDPSQQVLQAAAAGSRAGAMIAFALAHDDLVAAGRPSAHQRDWDHRYEGGQMWSGNPNGSLVIEASGLPPGRALDVGAGEGGDALWLAQQGWSVVASDISQLALDRVQAEAERRGLCLEYHHADANASSPFAAGSFNLVSAQYASIPRSPDDRGVRNVVEAVAPGGTLLVVSHDLEPLRAPIDTRAQSRAFDPDAYVRTDDFAAAVAHNRVGR